MNRGRYRAVRVKRGVIRVHRRSAIVVMLGLVLLSCLALYSLTLGDYGLGVADSLRRLTGDGGPSGDYLGVYFVQSVRLPRVVCAVAVGASLAIAGRIFQTISGNPLGSPDVVGLSAGSATGALVAIIILGASPAATGTGALIGGLVSGALVLACSGGTRVTGIRVVLVGIGCSAALRALNSLLVVKAPLEAAQRAQLWSAGSLNGVTFVRAFPLIVGLGVLGLSCACAATSIGLLAMGDDVATGLGVRVRVVRVSAIVSAIVLVALATAVAGPVAFVALSAPHIAARLCGGGGVGVVSSAVVGAALVLSADVVAQRIVAPAELPVGVVTGVLGGLYLLWILTREEAR
ncbi:FecCD family ABC transporter permease [Cellulomonas flavigena]|uniref:FecCD family ABC transporter permease n=1 Tax=Cellulomonas flavigena TaxID=1711 RepID=UPI000AF0A8C5|nr:iron chelate uptake ABC transporter family permease subunit [Cellulomonas flavigena]